MPRGKNQKLKLVKLLEILRKDSDETHPIPTNTLIKRLLELGIDIERKTLYEDINYLNDNGYEILKMRNQSNQYYIVDRPFEIAELKILNDAIHSAKFITENKTKVLSKKIASLAGGKSGEVLCRNIMCSDMVKHSNEQIYYNIDHLHTGIINKKKVSFNYFDYGINGKVEFRKNMERYIVNPVALLTEGDNCYLICYNDKYLNITNYRVDRMKNVEEMEENITDAECLQSFDLYKYTRETFNMFAGKPERVTIVAENSMANVIIDKFGEDVVMNKYDDNHFFIKESVQISPTFFSWCFLFGDKMRVVSPDNVVVQIIDKLRAIKKNY